MRRFVTLVFLLLFTIPFGISISGCAKKTSITYCTGDTGPIVGQATTITLTPKLYGISLNYAQIGQVATPTATDCKGNTVSISSYTYGLADANGVANMTIADVQPTTGKLCGGTWNRNTGGGIADFTTCNPNNISGTLYVTASAGGVNSNPIPIFVHPVVTSVVLGSPTPTASCGTTTDPSSNCCPLAADATLTAPPYLPNTCLSQTNTGQLASRVYDASGTNITCQVGHLTYTPQSSSIVTIDENGIATAQQPGSTIITANISNAGSSAGFFSTCPPASISLTAPNTGGTPTNVVVDQNVTQPLSASVVDIYGKTLTGLTLTYLSTEPTGIPAAAAGTVTPTFPGTAAITAICQPPSCNPSPINAVGLLGNGTPVASNSVTVTSPGTNSTLLYIGSTQSRYIVPVDFTTTTVGAPVLLPYAPNSMVISVDGSSIYMGSTIELMTFNATTNSLSKVDNTVSGNVLAVSPDGSTLIITDPVRQLIYLYATSGSVTSTYGGVATSAEFSPDSQTVYITTGTVTTPASGSTPAVIAPSTQLLVHSSFTGWSTTTLSAPASDVAITVPSVGAYLAGSQTNAVSYCPSTTLSSDGTTVIGNQYYPQADNVTVPSDIIAATNDGQHIIGATVTNGPNVVDLAFKGTPSGLPIGACPTTIPTNYFAASRTANNTIPLSGVTATSINQVLPTSNSTVAFVTYNGTGPVPAYSPSTGTVTNVALTGSATSPVAGAISFDNSTLFVGTAGDNAVHQISTTALTDSASKTITPNLPLYNTTTGTDNHNVFVVPNLIVQHPKKATS